MVTYNNKVDYNSIDKESNCSSIEVSVLMSIYDENYNQVSEAVKSILNQTFDKIEFIIVLDDPHNYEIKKYLSRINDSRIILIENKENIGLAHSMNIAIKASNGRYIARMDADDISFPTRLAQQFQYMEQNKDIGILGTQIKKFGDSSRYWLNVTEPKAIKAKLFFKCCIAHPTVMIRKSILIDRNLHYNTRFKSSQDYNLWSRASLDVSIANLPEVLLFYRVHKQQITQRNKKEQQKFFGESQLELVKNILGSITEEEKKISALIWKEEKITDKNDIASFESLIRNLIKQNRHKNIYNLIEFEVPIANLLVKRITPFRIKNYLFLFRITMKNGFFNFIHRKSKKKLLRFSIKRKFRKNNFQNTIL
ncbi:glycosyltransferase [Halosquirtibacter laminarini]|uniref:Glycosyltransferase n=1 Tax=Halosquirtibacter laminarini TaxID=3374600 RepID=A0AC61NML1_9BACT|nr:glycosyltransferase [Prolixibacteraceae bacterium]